MPDNSVAAKWVGRAGAFLAVASACKAGRLSA